MTTGINADASGATGTVIGLARPGNLPATVTVLDHGARLGKIEGLVLLVADETLRPPDVLQFVQGGVVHTQVLIE